MEFISANHAKRLTEVHKVNDSEQKQYEPVLKVINDRIQGACLYGKNSTSLGSVTDNGDLVRGIGTYLSKEVLDFVVSYLQKKGFKITTKQELGSSRTNDQYIISW